MNVLQCGAVPTKKFTGTKSCAFLELRDETSFLNFFFKKYWSKMIYFIKFFNER